MYLLIIIILFEVSMIFPLCERNVREMWLRDELKKWSSHFLDNLSDSLVFAPQKYQASSAGFEPMTSAIASQRSWVRILLKTPDIFQVHIGDNHCDCPASVRITSSITVICITSVLFVWSWMECTLLQQVHQLYGNTKKKHSTALEKQTLLHLTLT